VDLGKRNVLGVLVDAIDYAGAVDRIAGAALDRRPFAASALAVHGVMCGYTEQHFRHRLNRLDLVTPDGQPVRWALNLLHGTRLKDRVRGTTLTLRVLERAAADGLPVYFYGSSEDVLHALVENVEQRIPQITIAGARPSQFRPVSSTELAEIAAEIKGSGARIVLAGLGCPRQEVFADELREGVSCPVLAVGAAFDYLAGTLSPPPERLQALGLEWAWRLALEPRRLWRRYLLLNPLYLWLLLLQKAGILHPDPGGAEPEPGGMVPA
jgi:exopolysaccharide biosynthesis WecB/TagA/CpsF family protein